MKRVTARPASGQPQGITFTASAQAQTTTITFADDLHASVGTYAGQSAAVATNDGSVLITVAKTAEKVTEKVYLPWIER